MPEASIETQIGRVFHPQIAEFFLFDAELLETFYERLSRRGTCADSVQH